MHRFIGVLTAWVWLGSIAWCLQPHPLFSGDTLWVFKHDGTVHCGAPTGIPPETMAQELAAARITVLAMRRGYDGREGIALCGHPTGQINLYEVPAALLSRALAAGFRRWSVSLQRLPGENRQEAPW